MESLRNQASPIMSGGRLGGNNKQFQFSSTLYEYKMYEEAPSDEDSHESEVDNRNEISTHSRSIRFDLSMVCSNMSSDDENEEKEGRENNTVPSILFESEIRQQVDDNDNDETILQNNDSDTYNTLGSHDRYVENDDTVSNLHSKGVTEALEIIKQDDFRTTLINADNRCEEESYSGEEGAGVECELAIASSASSSSSTIEPSSSEQEDEEEEGQSVSLGSSDRVEEDEDMIGSTEDISGVKNDKDNANNNVMHTGEIHAHGELEITSSGSSIEDDKVNDCSDTYSVASCARSNTSHMTPEAPHSEEVLAFNEIGSATDDADMIVSDDLSTTDEEVSGIEETASTNNNMHTEKDLVQDDLEITSSDSSIEDTGKVDDEKSDTSSSVPSCELQSGSFKENVNSSSNHKNSVVFESVSSKVEESSDSCSPSWGDLQINSSRSISDEEFVEDPQLHLRDENTPTVSPTASRGTTSDHTRDGSCRKSPSVSRVVFGASFEEDDYDEQGKNKTFDFVDSLFTNNERKQLDSIFTTTEYESKRQRDDDGDTSPVHVFYDSTRGSEDTNDLSILPSEEGPSPIKCVEDETPDFSGCSKEEEIGDFCTDDEKHNTKDNRSDGGDSSKEETKLEGVLSNEEDPPVSLLDDNEEENDIQHLLTSYNENEEHDIKDDQSDWLIRLQSNGSEKTLEDIILSCSDDEEQENTLVLADGDDEEQRTVGTSDTNVLFRVLDGLEVELNETVVIDDEELNTTGTPDTNKLFRDLDGLELEINDSILEFANLDNGNSITPTIHQHAEFLSRQISPTNSIGSIASSAGATTSSNHLMDDLCIVVADSLPQNFVKKLTVKNICIAALVLGLVVFLLGAVDVVLAFWIVAVVKYQSKPKLQRIVEDIEHVFDVHGIISPIVSRRRYQRQQSRVMEMIEVNCALQGQLTKLQTKLDSANEWKKQTLLQAQKQKAALYHILKSPQARQLSEKQVNVVTPQEDRTLVAEFARAQATLLLQSMEPSSSADLRIDYDVKRQEVGGSFDSELSICTSNISVE